MTHPVDEEIAGGLIRIYVTTRRDESLVDEFGCFCGVVGKEHLADARQCLECLGVAAVNRLAIPEAFLVEL